MLTNETDMNMSYGNILLSLTENQSNLLSFDVNNSQLTIIPTDAKDDDQSDENNITAYFVNGVNLFGNSFLDTSDFAEQDRQDSNNSDDIPTGPRIISISILKPPSINSLDNFSTNGTFNSTNNPFLSKELPAKVPSQSTNFNGLNLDTPKEVTILVPEEEMHLLGQNNNFPPAPVTYSQCNGNYSQNQNVQSDNNSQSQKTKQPIAGTIDYPLPETEIQKNIRAFDLIFYNSHKIKMPNAMWGYHKNSIDKDIIIFSKAKWFKSDVLIPPIYEKQVIFHESDDIKIYINNKFSPLEVRRPSDIGELEVILRYVDETPVCSGGPSITECDTGHCAQKDYAVGRWRHKLCPIVVTPQETICKFCSTINQVMRYPKKRRPPFGRRFAKT